MCLGNSSNFSIGWIPAEKASKKVRRAGWSQMREDCECQLQAPSLISQAIGRALKLGRETTWAPQQEETFIH